jgi:hypothetical protein
VFTYIVIHHTLLYVIHCYTSYIAIRHTLSYVIHCYTSCIVICTNDFIFGTNNCRGNQLTLQREPVDVHERVKDKQIVSRFRGWQTKISPSCKPTNMQDSYANYVIYNNTRIRQWYKYSGMVFNRYIIFQFNPRKLEILFFGVSLTIIKTDEYMHKSYYYEYGNKSWYFSKWTFRRESDIN